MVAENCTRRDTLGKTGVLSPDRRRSCTKGGTVGDSEPGPVVFEIAEDDTFLHVAALGELLSHVADDVRRFHAPARTPAGARCIDFFDTAGRRLMPQIDQTLTLVGLAPFGRPTPRLVLRRIDRVLAHVQEMLDVNPSLGDRGPNLPPATSVPHVVGDLQEVAEILIAALDDSNRPTRGGWFHNAMHAAGWSH
jgi:hypothetical protein